MHSQDYIILRVIVREKLTQSIEELIKNRTTESISTYRTTKVYHVFHQMHLQNELIKILHNLFECLQIKKQCWRPKNKK